MFAAGASRSRARLEYHFDVERELARRIMDSDRFARKKLYTSVYDELFKRVVDHPQLQQKLDPLKRQRRIAWQVRYIEKLVSDDSDFLEIGPGDCALSIAVSRFVRTVTAVDVSNEITRRNDLPPNLCVVISDGTSIACADRSIDLAYSDQLMEHLHPEDAREQLDEVYRVLRPGGRYLVITPNRAIGPHDITKYFDIDAPQGLHLKEYTFAELDELLAAAGFAKRDVLVGAMGRYVKIPVSWAISMETLLLKMPRALRRAGIKSRITRPLLNLVMGARILAEKASH